MNINPQLLPDNIIMASDAKEQTEKISIIYASDAVKDIMVNLFFGIRESMSKCKYYHDHDFKHISNTQLQHVKKVLVFCGYTVSRPPGAFPETSLRILWIDPTK
jgi:hypothetical protein